MPETTTTPIAHLVEEWVKDTTGWFRYTDIWKNLNVESRGAKANIRQILKRLCDQGTIKRYPGEDGRFQLVKGIAEVVKWREADPHNIVPVIWPFGLEKYVVLYPKSAAVLGGDKSAGKTAYCLEFMRLNQHRPELAKWLPIQYFTSELGDEEMHKRLSLFQGVTWNIDTYRRVRDFDDVIAPDKINIIDYMAIHDQFWLVADWIDAIWEKLTTGIAIIVLQKAAMPPPDKSGQFVKTGWARGGDFSAEKARLYVTLSNKPDGHELLIKDGKNWAGEENPTGKRWHYKLLKGTKFIEVREVT